MVATVTVPVACISVLQAMLTALSFTFPSTKTGVRVFIVSTSASLLLVYFFSIVAIALLLRVMHLLSRFSHGHWSTLCQRHLRILCVTLVFSLVWQAVLIYIHFYVVKLLFFCSCSCECGLGICGVTFVFALFHQHP
jgi:hypothetical protein